MIPQERFYDEILTRALHARSQIEEMGGRPRWGQCLSIVLEQIDPETSQKLVGTEADCYYNDTLIPNYMARAYQAYYYDRQPFAE